MSILFDHHIILERFRGHPAFSDIDKQMFDIDSPENRIYLPADRELAAKLNVSPHPGRHVPSYGEAICKALNKIADIQTPGDRAAEIRTLIDAMRVGFANGDLYVNMPIGKTREEVDRGIARVLTDHKAYLSQYPDQLKAIRELEQRGANAGQNHLIKWLLYLDNPERQKWLDEVIARNPGINLTAGNQDLEGTRWQSKFAAPDPSYESFRIPGLPPADPSDFPPLPGSTRPSLGGINEVEGFARSDPRFTGGPPAFPVPSRDEKQFDQLPPSVGMPAIPQEPKFNSETSELLRFSDGSPMMGPNPYKMSPDSADGPAVLRGLAIFAAAMASPVLLPLLPALLPMAALGLAGAAAARAEPARGGKSGASAPEAPHRSFLPGQDGSNTNGVRSAAAQVPNGSFDQGSMEAGSFADRFGTWADTPAGAVLDQNGQKVSVLPAADAAAPQEVRRLTRVNTSNAGSVFASGSAPVPYLSSQEFNNRFGNWRMPTDESRPQQASKPIGTMADEPSYLIPPPIFGSDAGNPRNDGEEWFSRWVRPFFPPE
jgi:hypothetical protein